MKLHFTLSYLILPHLVFHSSRFDKTALKTLLDTFWVCWSCWPLSQRRRYSNKLYIVCCEFFFEIYSNYTCTLFIFIFSIFIIWYLQLKYIYIHQIDEVNSEIKRGGKRKKNLLYEDREVCAMCWQLIKTYNQFSIRSIGQCTQKSDQSGG